MNLYLPKATLYLDSRHVARSQKFRRSTLDSRPTWFIFTNLNHSLITDKCEVIELPLRHSETKLKVVIRGSLNATIFIVAASVENSWTVIGEGRVYKLFDQMLNQSCKRQQWLFFHITVSLELSIMGLLLWMPVHKQAWHRSAKGEALNSSQLYCMFFILTR